MMIKNEREYQEMVNRLEKDSKFLNEQWKSLKDLDLNEEQIQRAMEPSYAFHEQLKEEVGYYEKIQRGEFGAMTNFQGIGRLLIALRISKGISQKELADRMDVSESQISRDERNEYHNITIERANRVLNALEVVMVSHVNNEPQEQTVIY